jgi:3D (Asp-Asp-Asp) domain-containing protein
MMKLHKYVGLGLVILCIIGCYFVMLPGEKRNVVKKYAFELKPLNKVSLTTYTTDTSETDSFPLITASGLHLDSANPKKGRIIAISRDLQKLFSFGDRVILRNAGKFNGIWFIHDLMNKRWKNKIDILINPDEPQISLEGVVISKI